MITSQISRITGNIFLCRYLSIFLLYQTLLSPAKVVGWVPYTTRYNIRIIPNKVDTTLRKQVGFNNNFQNIILKTYQTAGYRKCNVKCSTDGRTSDERSKLINQTL